MLKFVANLAAQSSNRRVLLCNAVQWPWDAGLTELETIQGVKDASVIRVYDKPKDKLSRHFQGGNWCIYHISVVKIESSASQKLNVNIPKKRKMLWASFMHANVSQAVKLQWIKV